MKKSIGSRWKVEVPKSFMNSMASAAWMGAIVEIISKQGYRKNNPGPIIPASRVAVNIISAPKDSPLYKRIGKSSVIWKSWLFPFENNDDNKHLCKCSIRTIWITGCKCGGI